MREFVSPYTISRLRIFPTGRFVFMNCESPIIVEWHTGREVVGGNLLTGKLSKVARRLSIIGKVHHVLHPAAKKNTKPSNFYISIF